MERGALLGRLTRRLYRLGSAAAFLGAAFAVVQVVIEVIALDVAGTPPASAQQWLEMLVRYPLFGVTELTVFQLPLFVLLIVVLGAICIAVRDVDELMAGTAFVIALVGITVYLATNPVLAMLSLSKDYGIATSDAERATLAAAARAAMALAVTSVDVGTSLVSISWLGLSILMRRSGNFAWLTVALVVLAGVIELVAVGVDVLTRGSNILLLEIAGASMVLWLLFAGRDLGRLAQGRG